MLRHRLALVWVLSLLAALCVPVCSGKEPPPRVTLCGKQAHRYAYVTIHYEGTPRDAEYVLGVRVLLASLQATSSNADHLILVSPTVSDATVQQLCGAGALVQLVHDIPNPFKHEVKPRFLLTLNKLHLWRLTQYDAVTYMDADVIATQSMDVLFPCGTLCVVYMNPCHFHTALMVVKPDLSEYDRLIDGLQGSKSHDGADQGFLSHMYGPGMISAPLYVGGEQHTQNTTYSSFSAGLRRLPSQANMHHMYIQETSSWDIYRIHPPFRNMAKPFLSMTYPVAPLLKPWYWWTYALFIMNWEWLDKRDLLHDDYSGQVAMLAVLPVIALAVTLPAARRAVVNDQFRSTMKAVATRYATLVSPIVRPWRLLGWGTFVAGATLGFQIIPPLLPPRHAWPLFALYCYSVVFAFARMLRMRVAPSRNDGTLPTLLSMVPMAAVSLLFSLVVFSSSSYFTAGPSIGLRVWACLFGAIAHAVTASRAIKDAAYGSPVVLS